jgi:hypothetical protein
MTTVFRPLTPDTLAGARVLVASIRRLTASDDAAELVEGAGEDGARWAAVVTRGGETLLHLG